VVLSSSRLVPGCCPLFSTFLRPVHATFLNVSP
jgi:hypothetical protein